MFKSRIDYETMVIADPDTVSSATTAAAGDGANVGDCNTDTLSSRYFIINLTSFFTSILVGVPGFTPPPIICGYNTGQHMWVPACPSCVTITIDVDTANTATTRQSDPLSLDMT